MGLPIRLHGVGCCLLIWPLIGASFVALGTKWVTQRDPMLGRDASRRDPFGRHDGHPARCNLSAFVPASHHTTTCAIVLCTDPAALDALTYVPTLVGLLSIAVIVQPLDVLADVLFDATLREYVFDKLPVDHSGKITEDMVVDRITSRNDGQPMLSEEQLRALFRKVDTDADGYITLAEWRRDGHEVYNRYMQELQVRCKGGVRVIVQCCARHACGGTLWWTGPRNTRLSGTLLEHTIDMM